MLPALMNVGNIRRDFCWNSTKAWGKKNPPVNKK